MPRQVAALVRQLEQPGQWSGLQLPVYKLEKLLREHIHLILRSSHSEDNQSLSGYYLYKVHIVFTVQNKRLHYVPQSLLAGS